MHELGIMESAVGAALRHARQHGARHVHRVVLRIGKLAGVEPQALRFAFEVVVRGTPAERAELEIETVPARVRCDACDVEFDVAGGFIFPCPRCARFCGEVKQGRELELSRVEMS